MSCSPRPQALVCALAGSLLCCVQAHAWGPVGHRISGMIAEQYLGSAARAGVQQVIGDEGLPKASTWADEMRGDPSRFWQEVAGPWHYVTVPDGKRYADVGAPPQGDAVSALDRFRRALLDPGSSLAERQLALRFSIHIIADLHQPFHVGNGLDRGGNSIKVIFDGEKTNLHAVWDSKLIDLQGLAPGQWAATQLASLPPTLLTAWDSPDPQAWIAESGQIRRGLYPQQATIGSDYAIRHAAIVRQRLLQSGVRIASYLNELYEE